ncbi:hypothetical protein NEOLEDRAFT_1075616 [Neolentinus lepideus HHB14362 ss-1]|uniref:Major facilitator superfamily (MFS) profile domain-containing protein n=1 Tax=Neolentinus lepideus HHB14362 ss-1 TaxID=1314782 RepID=A0A165P2Y2_9AGAM|nr:hypothetical protein NEOLEDRAFT_1075616 [Neolentinus lepideus HHB14362 ss-1]
MSDSTRVCLVGTILIYINASAPSKRSVGATNGLTQTSVSILRAIGPALATSVFALSADRGWLGGNFVYTVFVLLTAASLFVTAKLPLKPWDVV